MTGAGLDGRHFAGRPRLDGAKGLAEAKNLDKTER